jgi:hypothetical protein
MDERHQILAAATKTGRQGVNVSTILVALSLASLAREAAAQDFSHDGYTPDGAYQLNVEVDPFGFLPHAAASASGLGPRGRAGLSGSIGPWQIVESLKGALFATGVVRYGPYSAELNIDWVDLSQGKSIAVPRLGTSVHLSGSASAVLVSPGIGYQVYRGAIALAPISVDVRAGFNYFSWSASASTAADVLGGVGGSGDKVTPWIGVRADLFPMPNWRVRFAGDISGLGTNNDNWGWTTSLTLTYLVNNWFDVSIGMTALGTAGVGDHVNLIGNTHQRSLHTVQYGPVIGVGFRF